MAVPNTFASATSSIPLANLDANFAYYDAGFSLSGSAVTFAGSITLTTGTANGVPYLNASKVLTSGAVLTFDGTTLSSTKFAGALNGTVGATTPTTGAFTTLSATGTAATNTTFLSATGTTTGFNRERIFNTGGDLRFGIDSSVGAEALAGSAAYSSFIGSFTNTPFYLVSNSAIVGTVSSTGLAVTGTLSATGRSGVTMSGQTSAISLGQVSTDPTYGLLSFNGAFAATTLTGIWGGAGSPDMIIGVPTGGSIYSRVNNSTVTLLNSTGLAVTGAISATGGVSPQLIATESGGLLYAAVQLQATSAGGKVWTIASNATSSPLGTAGGLSFRDSSVGTTYMNLTTTGLAVTGTLSASGATTISAQLTASTGDGTYPIISKDTRAFSAGVTGPQLGFFGLDSTSTNNSLGAIRALAQTSQNGTLEARVLVSGSIATIGTFSSTGLAVTGALSSTLGATIQGLTVGRGAGAVASNTAVGASALAANTTGTDNTALGDSALLLNSTGTQNTAIGRVALANTTASFNTGLGFYALALNTSGASNTAVGVSALQSNTTASYNTAVGYQAGYSNTTGTLNTSLGNLAGYSNSTSNAVTAIGSLVLQNNTAAYNTGVGYNALNANTTGTSNVAVGSADATTSAALRSNTTGSFNSALGVGALGSNTTASNNTAVGYQAGYSNTTGAGNVALGYLAGYSTTTGTGQNTSAGSYAFYANTTGYYNSAFGSEAMYYNTTGVQNTAVGKAALGNNTTASNNTAVGFQAGYTNTTGDVTAVGRLAMYSNTTGVGSTAMGLSALYSNNTGASNTAFGYSALYSNTTASNNTAVGYQAGYSNTTGPQTVSLGYQALYSNTTGGYHTAIGYQALASVTTGGFNAALGQGAGSAITTGSKNTIIGGFSGNQGGLDIRTASNYIVLSDGDGNPRGVFDGSGNLLVGTTSTSGATGFAFISPGSSSVQRLIIGHVIGNTTGDTYHEFNYNSSQIGSITQSGTTGVLYNVTSDYRLKTVVGPVADAGQRIDALQPVEYTWNAGGERTRGFLAHQFQEVYPSSVSGDKDAVDAEGKPVYQSMQASTSEVIADLVAELQSLRARVAQLESKP